MAGDGLIVKLLSGFGVVQSGRITVHGGADCAPTYAVARLVQAHESALQAGCAGHEILRGHVHVFERQATGDRCAQ